MSVCGLGQQFGQVLLCFEPGTFLAFLLQNTISSSFRLRWPALFPKSGLGPW
jgi:hypothetical protein